MPDGQTATPAPPAPTAPAPGHKCGTCGKEREVKMNSPAKAFGNPPAKGTKFRSMAVKRGPQRTKKRDPRFVRFY